MTEVSLKNLLQESFDDSTIPSNFKELEGKFCEAYMILSEDFTQITKALTLQNTFTSSIKPLFLEYIKEKNVEVEKKKSEEIEKKSEEKQVKSPKAKENVETEKEIELEKINSPIDQEEEKKLNENKKFCDIPQNEKDFDSFICELYCVARPPKNIKELKNKHRSRVNYLKKGGNQQEVEKLSSIYDAIKEAFNKIFHKELESKKEEIETNNVMNSPDAQSQVDEKADDHLIIDISQSSNFILESSFPNGDAINAKPEESLDANTQIDFDNEKYDEQEVKNKGKLISYIEDEGKEKSKTKNIRFSFMQTTKDFIQYFKVLNEQDQFLSLNSLQGYSTKIFHNEANGNHFMYARFYNEENSVDSPIMIEKNKGYCRKRVEKWVITKFLEEIQSDNVCLCAMLSDQNQTKILEKERKEIGKLKRKNAELNIQLMKFWKKRKENEKNFKKERMEDKEKHKEMIKEYERLLELYYQDTGELKNLDEHQIDKLMKDFDSLSKRFPSFLYTDEKGHPYYYVEDVIGYKLVKEKEYYAVKWLGDRVPTWEPAVSLKHISKDLLNKAKMDKERNFAFIYSNPRPLKKAIQKKK